MSIKIVKCQPSETKLFLNECTGHIFPNNYPFVVCKSDIPVMVFEGVTNSSQYFGEYWLTDKQLDSFLKENNINNMKEPQKTTEKRLELENPNDLIIIVDRVSIQYFELSSQDLVDAICLWTLTKKEMEDNNT